MNNFLLKQLTRLKGQVALDRFKVSFVLMVLMYLSVSVSAAEYVVDKAISKVNWEARKVTGKHNGYILVENGSVMVTDNIISGGTVVINMKSIADVDITDAGMKEKLMGHLASDDFFSVAKFPESTLVIKQVTPVKANEFHFVADLTIKGVTKPVEFNAKVSLYGDKLSADGIISVNRTHYGIKYGSGSFFKGLGDKMINDEFTIAFNVVAQKK